MIDEKEIVKKQIELCKKYKSKWIESPLHLKVGISLNIKDGIQPINGMRYQLEGDTTGWYIWAGENFSTDEDFFKPLHVSHLEEWAPQVLKYLGLEPGFRFLITDDYEDVWEDKSLLK